MDVEEITISATVSFNTTERDAVVAPRQRDDKILLSAHNNTLSPCQASCETTICIVNCITLCSQYQIYLRAQY